VGTTGKPRQTGIIAINPSKASGVKWLHFKAFRATLVQPTLSNFSIFEIGAPCHLRLSARVPESQKIKKGGLNQYGTERLVDSFCQNQNKSAQSNLGRGPNPCAVAHVQREVPIGYNGAPHICPKSTPSCGPIPKPHYLSHPWTCPTYDAKQHPDPIRCFSTMHWTDQLMHKLTHRLTGHSRESLMTIGRCATRATRPEKYGTERVKMVARG